MNPVFRRVARIITWVFIVVAVLFWLLTVVGWFITDPGFEPANVVASVALSGLAVLFGWLGRGQNEAVKQVRFVLLSGSASLSAGGVEYANGQFSLSSELVIGFYAKMCIHNPSLPVSAKLSIASIEPASLSGCLSDGLSLTDIDVVVESKEHPNWASIELGNPFSIVSGDRNIDVSAKIPFSIAQVERVYGALASLKEAAVVFKADFEATSQHLLVAPLQVDLASIHRQIEKHVTSKIPKYQVRSTQAIDTEQLVQTLKRYWLGETER